MLQSANMVKKNHIEKTMNTFFLFSSRALLNWSQ